MEVGNYVRTKTGEIGKISYISEYNTAITTDYYENPNIAKTVGVSKIVKTSSDILDLLQPMDLMYIDISPDNCDGIVVLRIPETYCELEQIINEIKLGNYVLKGIVTKEQLMKNMYKVESEVN